MAPEQRMLLSDSQAIDGYSESGTECPPHQWGKLAGGKGRRALMSC